MFEDASKLVDICVKLKITANQFLLCYLLYTDEKIEGRYPSKGRPIANLYKYSANEHTRWEREEVEDLVKKGYLTHTPKKGLQTSSIYPDDLAVEPSFIDQVMAAHTRFEQLNMVYPFVEEHDGKTFQLKVCDLDKMENLYNRAVRTNSLHNHILELIGWAKENGGIQMKLENFILAKGWRIIEERRNKHDQLSYENQQLG